jgi:hypothetical protein
LAMVTPRAANQHGPNQIGKGVSAYDY